MVDINNFKSTSVKTLELIRSRAIRLPRNMLNVGLEIEQGCPRRGKYGRIFRPNPNNLPEGVPEGLMRKAIDSCDGHDDGSGPFEFVMKHRSDMTVLHKDWTYLVGSDVWAWHNELNNGSACGPHIHISPRGDVNLGDGFGNQKSAPVDFWTITWNNLIQFQLMCAPAFVFGKFGRRGWTGWSRPVLERMGTSQIISLLEAFSPGYGSNSITLPNTGVILQLGHDTSISPAWNCRPSRKKAVTLELRLNEGHPNFTIPIMQMFNIISRQSFLRFSSIKIKKDDEHYRVMGGLLNGIFKNPVYEGLYSVKDITFEGGRGIPFLCGRQETTFPSALDLFREMCRKFIKIDDNDTMNFGKVLRLFSDFIDFDNIPSHLLWNVPELYRLVYEDANKVKYQDEYLYFGHKAVVDPGRKSPTVKELIA